VSVAAFDFLREAAAALLDAFDQPRAIRSVMRKLKFCLLPCPAGRRRPRFDGGPAAAQRRTFLLREAAEPTAPEAIPTRLDTHLAPRSMACSLIEARRCSSSTPAAVRAAAKQIVQQNRPLRPAVASASYESAALAVLGEWANNNPVYRRRFRKEYRALRSWVIPHRTARVPEVRYMIDRRRNGIGVAFPVVCGDLVPNFTEARVKTITGIPESLESLGRRSLGSRASDSGY